MAKQVVFSDEARGDVRAIDRETALRLLIALARYLETDAGDVKQLVGDWRLIFRKRGDDSIEILRVRNRREAYR
jgi:hypothetical protein